MTAIRPTQPWKYAQLTYLAVVVCWITYAVLTLFAPHSANARFHLAEPELALLQLTVIVPLHLIWLAAAYGTVMFKHYAQVIHDGLEAPAFNHIANGLLVTITYLIANTLLGAVIPFLAHSRLLDVIVIVRDHITPIGALIGFYLLYRGSHQLRSAAKFTTWTKTALWLLVGFGLFSAAFVLDFTLSPNPPSSGNPSSLSLLPHALLVFTLVLPYLAGWFMGLLASVNIAKYSRHVNGVLYRRALRDLRRGIWGVILFGVALQILTFSARFLTNLSLGWTLLLVYILLLLYGLGFLFVRSGAKKLTQIEVIQ
jgi:hypothetical protein